MCQSSAFYHSDLPLLVGNRMGNWVTPNVEAYVTKLYGNFDRVLAPSQVMADKLTGLGVKNVFVQPWGVDLQMFHPDARDTGLRAELGIDENTHLLIFAGRGSKEKNLPVLLKCMKRLGPTLSLAAGRFVDADRCAGQRHRHRRVLPGHASRPPDGQCRCPAACR